MAVSALGQLALMARYHGGATKRLLSAITPFPEQDYRRRCGLFFGSIHGTLNHLLLTDSKIWYPGFSSGHATGLSLDAELESDRSNLASHLIAAALQWPGYFYSHDETALAGDLPFMIFSKQPT